LEGGPPSFPQGSTCLVVLRIPIGPHAVSHTGLSPSAVALSRAFCYNTRSHIWVLQPQPYNKKDRYRYRHRKKQRKTSFSLPLPVPFYCLLCCRVGLGSSPFARRYSENLFRFLFLRVLRCFTSPGLPHTPIYSAYDIPTFLGMGCPIRTPTDLRSLAAPRGFS
jgi:hypothetical protein